MHLPTLLGVTAMMLSLLGLLLFVVRGRGSNADALVWWGAAMVTGGAGLALAATGAPVPLLLRSDFANAIMLLAAALSWSAARVFVGRPIRPALIAAGPTAWLALRRLPLIHASSSAEIVIPCTIGAAYTWAAAVELWRSREEDLPSRKAAYLLLAVHGAFYFGRAALAAAGVDQSDARLAQLFPTVLLIETLLHTTGMTLVLLAMTKDRAELRSRRSLMAARDAALSVSDAKSKFLARMSHEVRTPLNAVLGLAQVLGADQRLTRDQQEQVITLEQAGRHLLTIVNDLLDLAKVDAGKLDLAYRPLALRRFVEGCLALLEPTAEVKRVELEIDLDPDAPPVIEGDETRLRQILLNLLSNAIKFSPVGKCVTVRLRARMTGLWIAVVDSGPGVPPEKRGLLFQDFTQLDPLKAHEFGGSGLGLAISAALARAMGGRIGHEPRAGEQGSIFWVEIPLRASAQPEAPGAKISRDSVLRHGSGCILVVDDMPSNRFLMKAMLERAGFRVCLATGGADAILAVADGGIDLVLMDVQMPEVNGLEATRRIRELPPPASETPIVALTADVMHEHVQACLDAGMTGHVSKPVDWTELIAEIDRVMTRQPTRLTSAAG